MPWVVSDTRSKVWNLWIFIKFLTAQVALNFCCQIIAQNRRITCIVEKTSLVLWKKFEIYLTHFFSLSLAFMVALSEVWRRQIGLFFTVARRRLRKDYVSFFGRYSLFLSILFWPNHVRHSIQSLLSVSPFFCWKNSEIITQRNGTLCNNFDQNDLKYILMATRLSNGRKNWQKLISIVTVTLNLKSPTGGSA